MFWRLVGSAFALAVIGFVHPVEAQRAADKWVRIQSSEVDLAKDTNTIDTSKAKGSFKAVRVEAKRGKLAVSNIEIRYTGGKVHQERRQINLASGDRTKGIDQRDEERFIDAIVISSAVEPKKKALLEVWGLQSAGGSAALRPASGAIAATATPPTPSTAAPGTVTGGGDVMFGAQLVGFAVDRDVIKVGNEVGKFAKVRLRVLDNDIYLNEMKVVYPTGEADTLAVSAEIKQNTRTRWFDLKGDRFINEIQFTYRSRPNFKGQARVEVYGQYAPGWLGAKGEGRNYNQGWVLLGAQSAGFVGFDDGVIPVGSNEGGFRRLRVSVRDRAITLNELRVIYEGGGDDLIPVKEKVDAGTTYGPVDLKGGARAIKEIRAKYRSRFIDRKAVGKGAAVVEVWGQH